MFPGRTSVWLCILPSPSISHQSAFPSRHWYYEDFIREENHKFPSLPLKRFSEMFFQACPLLERWRGDHDGAFDHFMRYKTRVPVCGAIMLNDSWDKVRFHAFLL